jgi:hypothetical protein
MVVGMRKHNVVAVYKVQDRAAEALRVLRDAQFGEEDVSVLTQEQAAPEGSDPEELFIATHEGAKDAAKGAVLGAGAGGLLGMLGDALALAIPGVGPALGVGLIAAAAASGAAAGGTVGFMYGAMEKLWDMQYRDVVAGGGALVAVHTDDPERAAEAKRLLAQAGPERIDEFDAHGELVHEA